MYTPLAFDSFSQRYEGYPPIDVRPFKSLALCDEDVAIRILWMPFLDSRIDGLDGDVVRGMARIAESDLRKVDKVLSHPLIEGGITKYSRALAMLLILEQEQAETAAAIQELTWVQSAIDEAKLSLDEVLRRYPAGVLYGQLAVGEMVTMARRSPQTLTGLLDLAWLQDNLAKSEYRVIVVISIIASKDDTEMARVVRMPFLQTLEPEDEEVLDILYEARRGSLRQLLSDPALKGGISDGMKHLVAFAALRLQNPNVAANVEALSWVQDGLDQEEEDGVSSLWYLASISVPASQEITAKKWVEDGLNETEWSAINALAWMLGISQNQVDIGHSSHHEQVLTIPAMAFMETIEPVDIAALDSMRILLQSEGRYGYLQQVLSHPSLRGGIRDDLTPVISMLSKASLRRPELLEVMLDPEQTLVEERSLSLPHAGELHLWVIWPEMSAPTAATTRTMDLLENSVATIEGFMGIPYPEGYTVVLVADVQLRGTATGGPLMTLSRPVANSPGVIAHETAHVYWHYWNNPSSSTVWIIEGAADFLARVSENARTGAQLPEPRDTCSLAGNIAALVRLPDERGNEIYFSACNYILGEGVFLDLYQGLGEEAFRQYFSNLYLLLRNGALQYECTGVDEGLCLIKAAFVTGATTENAAIAEEIIDRRYYGE